MYWGTGTAHLLPRLLRLPDGSSRTSGPLFLSSAAVAEVTELLGPPRRTY